MTESQSSGRTTAPVSTSTPEDGADDVNRLVGRHLRTGWWALLAFLSIGVVLEALHAFKVGWYLEPAYQTRRLLWTLAHAHGTLLGLIHVAFAGTIVLADLRGKALKYASAALLAATLLLPGGFFAGGIFIHDTDPGWGIMLVPAGALALLLSVLLIAACTSRAPIGSSPNAEQRVAADDDAE